MSPVSFDRARCIWRLATEIEYELFAAKNEAVYVGLDTKWVRYGALVIVIIFVAIHEPISQTPDGVAL